MQVDAAVLAEIGLLYLRNKNLEAQLHQSHKELNELRNTLGKHDMLRKTPDGLMCEKCGCCNESVSLRGGSDMLCDDCVRNPGPDLGRGTALKTDEMAGRPGVPAPGNCCP
jgi:hypothetical protein